MSNSHPDQDTQLSGSASDAIVRRKMAEWGRLGGIAARDKHSAEYRRVMAVERAIIGWKVRKLRYPPNGLKPRGPRPFNEVRHLPEHFRKGKSQ